MQGGAQKEEKLLIHLENHRGGEKITWNQNKFLSVIMKHKEKSPNRWVSVPEVEDPPHISPEIVFLFRVEGHFHHLHHLPPIIVVVKHCQRHYGPRC